MASERLASLRRHLRDGRPVDGGHGGGESPIERVVENRRADVGHDGVQQRLTQVLLFGWDWRGRWCWLKQTEQSVTHQSGKIRESKQKFV